MIMELNNLMLLDLVLLLFLLISSVAIIFARNMLTVIVLLAIFSLLMALMYLVMEAPDVAITEAAIGAGVSTMLFLAALVYTGAETRGPSTNPLFPLVVVGITGAALLYATFDMPPYGAADAPAQQHIKPYFIQQGPQQTGIPNVVTSVLASYRGIDTFGEVVVVFTAAVGVLLMLDGLRKPGHKGKGDA